MRNETDRMLSTAWAFIPLVAVVLMLIGMVSLIFYLVTTFPTALTPPTDFIRLPALAGIVVMMVVLVFAAVAIYAYLLYILIKRRNKHFMRQSLLVEDLLPLLRSLAARKGVNVDMQLYSIERTMREMKMEESEKSAVLWVVLTFIGNLPGLIASLYVLYFLMKDYFRHERGEDILIEDLHSIFDRLKTPLAYRREVPMKERSFPLYLILSIVTLGFFGIYWLYVLIKDPNEHFKNHILLEDEVITLCQSA